MRKFLIVLMVVAITSFLFVGCNGTPPNHAPVITTDVLPVATVGTAYTAIVEATDADGDALTFSLVGPTGMVISKAGVISGWTPAKVGTEAVTVAVTDGTDSVSAPFTITVSAVAPEPELQLVGIEVDPNTMDLIVGGTEDIDSVTACYEVRGYGVDIDLGDCLFLTSDKDVATVEEDNGVATVTAKGVGTADILVSYKGKIDTVAVTVIAKALDHITVQPKTMGLIVGGTDTITSVTAYYNNGSFAAIPLDECTYVSDYPTVADVEENEGVVTVTVTADPTLIPVDETRELSATITVTYEGKTDTIEVTVTVTGTGPLPE